MAHEKKQQLGFIKGKYPFIPKELEGQLKIIPVSKVRLWKDDPRINDIAAKELAELIRVHGFRDPIELDKDGSVAKAGNARRKAAKILKMTHVPVIEHIFTSKAASNAYGISNNRAGENAEWDKDVLSKLMGTRSFAGFRGKTGFESNEISLRTHKQELLISNEIPLQQIAGFFSKNKSAFRILDYARLSEDYLLFTDLNLYCKIDVLKGRLGLINLNLLKEIGSIDLVQKATKINMDIDDFPEPVEGKLSPAPLNVSTDFLKMVSEYASKDITRGLNHVFIDSENKIVFGTDGHIGVMSDLSSTNISGSLSIPFINLMSVIEKGIHNSKREFFIGENLTSVKYAGITIIESIKDDFSMPNFKAVLPTKFEYSIILTAEEITRILKGISAILPFMMDVNKMIILEGSILRNLKSSKLGYVCFDTGIYLTKKPIGLSAIYLQKILSDILQIMGKEPITIFFTDNVHSAILFTTKDITFLQMPLRVIDDESLEGKPIDITEYNIAENVSKRKLCKYSLKTPYGEILGSCKSSKGFTEIKRFWERLLGKGFNEKGEITLIEKEG